MDGCNQQAAGSEEEQDANEESEHHEKADDQRAIDLTGGVGDDAAAEHCDHKQEHAGPDPHQQVCMEAIDHRCLPCERERPAKLLGDDRTWFTLDLAGEPTAARPALYAPPSIDFTPLAAAPTRPLKL